MTDATRPGAAYVYDALVEAGVELLVGLPGTQTLPLDRVVARRAELRYVMARHETAVPHVAWGHYEAGGTPAATVTVPGPGETNAMHGLKNALEDCVPLLHVTGDAGPDEWGRGPIHEIDPATYGAVVKENVVVESQRELPAAAARGVELALTPPYGPVRLGVPHEILAAEFAAPTATVEPERVARDNAAAYDAAAAVLADASRPVVYAGGGVRRSPGGVEALREFARAVDAPVVTSYKGKGTFPEDDPRFLGVAGGTLPAGAVRALERADAVLALGSDLDGVATRDWSLPLGERLVHVTLRPDDLDAGYDADVGIVADAADAVAALRARVPDRPPAERWDAAAVGRAVRAEYGERLAGEGLYGATDDGLHTPGVLRTVRETVPDDAVVTVDVGGFRLWAMQAFETYEPETIAAAGSWAGMGVGLPAAVGAALASPDRPVVCLTGDGGLLMCLQELATVVEEGLDVTVVVSNNADYGVISKQAEAPAFGDQPFAWTSPDFPAVAEGFGWQAASVADATALAGALGDALARDDPTLIDVEVPADEPTAAAAAAYETDLEF